MKSRRFPQALEPRRPKTHWDHVLEEMVWLSKDFESERKWKLAQAKKVALRASRGMLDQATRGEKKQKEEEQRLRKVALNISKDVKKFWIKIEKLVLYKHQMELDEKKKKALDKQLEFLLGQTERYSTMLAENLVDKPSKHNMGIDRPHSSHKEEDTNFDDEPVDLNDDDDVDDYDAEIEDESEDDEHTIEEDEAHITAKERQEELAALHDEIDLPLEELLKRYDGEQASRGSSPQKDEAEAKPLLQEEDPATIKGDSQGASEVDASSSPVLTGRRCDETNGELPISENREVETDEARNLSDLPAETAKKHVPYDFNDDQEDGDFVLNAGEEKDDETTLSEEEELAKEDAKNPADEIALLQKESEIPLEELLARYKKEITNDEVLEDQSENASALSEMSDSPDNQDTEMKQMDISVDGSVERYQSLPDGLPLTEEEKTSEDGDKMIADAAAAARSAQPTGNTFSTTQVRTKFPFLLKYPLREYQHIGLDWLVTMYEKRLNGILADEMGLGKTIMTIALLAHLACEKGIWGPHLIVVPTSVMLNWETEFLKWCPAFKILTYFGSAKERKFKRQGWMKPNSFHVCITTYRLVIQDSKVFKRKKWKYLILDEAHLIKNWKSQRWQTLLNFNSKRRILLTGTPLQNDIMELWSLMHFLMPHVFQSHQEFKDWFSNPITGMVEGQERVNKEVIDRLHNVLRPFILRRLKRDVETQLPMKHEHVIYCRLSKRQRNLYEDFIASSETQATLASANFFGMISIIMQLRKVCNHPDLFEGRPIISSFDMAGIDMQLSSSVCSMLSSGPFSTVDLRGLGLIFTHLDFCMTSWEFDEVQAISTPSRLIEELAGLDNLEEIRSKSRCQEKSLGTNIFEEIRKAVLDVRLREAKERAASIAWWNSLSCRRKPIYSTNLRELLTIKRPVDDIHQQKVHRLSYLYSSKLADVVLSPVESFQNMIDQVESFMFAIPAARAPVPACWCSKTEAPVFLSPSFKEKCSEVLLPLLSPIRPAIVRRQVYFPDRRLIQFDCGKLQELAVLLRKLKSEGHRALIFTQMTKMLDVLEAFINLYGYTYMRLDGSTQPEERQTLMQRFNTNPKIFLFILSTRSGGVGINLVGADTVIFYDSDWNPAMDQQAQDRCHRIGQTREVHIYRLISESTIEENILKKANQKRALDDLVIQSGGYNTEFFKKLDPMELFSGHKALVKDIQKVKNHVNGADVSLSNDDVEAALKYAEDEADYMALKRVEQEEAVDNQEFTEEATGRMEDDELVNDDDMRIDEPIDQKVGEHNEPEMIANCRDNGINLNETDPIEERALTFAANEDDLDMLADVRQMAAAGQTVSSFENQLRPIDKYAIRFLELWDPIVDKAASPVGFEETEWELDRIEKYKEEMEAEIDDDEEPLVYERWDAEFATEAYRQQVEALAQHQLMEEMEAEANEKEHEDDGDFDTVTNGMASHPKPKSKKKPKKAKFKSLKKGSLASGLKKVKEEPSVESMSLDDEVFNLDDATYSDTTSPYSSVQRKRKKSELAFNVDAEKRSSKKSKKPKKASEISCPDGENLSCKQHGDAMELRPCDNVIEHKSVSRNKAGKKISISAISVKRILLIKPEKLKKGYVWSRDCVPPPDSWLPQEDAVLCAVVHEYGPHWSLVSETLYGMTAGGFYRGRYRHPVHCCERFRELIQRYVLSTPENPINEKMSSAGSGKALLKVTEDHIRMLLNVAAEKSDQELLLQKHFTALLSSAWRMKLRADQRQCQLPSSRNGLFFNGRFFIYSLDQLSWNSMKEPPSRIKLANLEQSSKLLAAALRDANSTHPDEGVSCPSWRENSPVSSEKLELTLEFQNDEVDSLIPFPPVINLSIPSSEPPTSVKKDMVQDHLKAFTNDAESRFRDAAEAFFDDSLCWASSSFSVNDAKSRVPSKPQSLGKHKLPVSDMIKPPRSKMKRTSDQNEARHLFAEPVLQMTSTVSPSDPSLRFELTPATDQDGWTDDTFESPLSNMDGDLSLEMSFEAVPHNYNPDLISGLDDCSLLPEYTDIG